METTNNQGNKAVAIWLLLGVGMIVVQVLIGGITRLTGSGLSITEWKPLLGAMPPTSAAAWDAAFDQYKKIGQFKYINPHFTLDDFKFIYFWEWFHRVWARLIGLVFIIGFVYLWTKRYLHRLMIQPMLILFFLGGLQGALGWIMVKSGLNDEDIYVSHIRLAIHFIAAMGLLAFTLWFALRLWVPVEKRSPHQQAYKRAVLILPLLIFQFIYGAFMAGLKAATAATTWPTINGEWFPSSFQQFGNRTYSGLAQWTDHPIAVHLVHRTTAYLLFFLIITWCVQVRKVAKPTSYLFSTWWWSMILVSLQVVLGILTVLFAANANALLWLGVAHQFVAMLLLMNWIGNIFLVKPTYSDSRNR